MLNPPITQPTRPAQPPRSLIDLTPAESVLLADYTGCCGHSNQPRSYGRCQCCGGDGAPFCTASCAAKYIKGKC